MSFNRQIKAAKAISTQTIGTALQHDRRGPVELHDVLDNQLEYVEVVGVGNAFFQWHVNRIVTTVFIADLEHVACARKESVSVLVKRHGHYTVRQVEGFLHTVTVMYVNVYVEYAQMNSVKNMQMQFKYNFNNLNIFFLLD